LEGIFSIYFVNLKKYFHFVSLEADISHLPFCERIEPARKRNEQERMAPAFALAR